MLAVMCGKMIFSRVLAMEDSSDIGLYDVPRLGSLFGFGIGMMWASFQIWGIMLLLRARL